MRTIRSTARMFFVVVVLALIALIATAPSAHAQRGATNNPYPQTKTRPATLSTSKTAQEKFYRDSLRAAYPVNSANEACWKFNQEVSIPGGDGYFCFRDRGTVLDSVSRYGNMATYYRGKWENLLVEGRSGLVMVEWLEPGKAARSSAIVSTMGMPPAKPTTTH